MFYLFIFKKIVSHTFAKKEATNLVIMKKLFPYEEIYVSNDYEYFSLHSNSNQNVWLSQVVCRIWRLSSVICDFSKKKKSASDYYEIFLVHFLLFSVVW